MAEKKRGFFSKIESREDALKLVKGSSVAFFVVAAIQAALGFWLAPSLLVDAGLFAVGGFLLRRYNSRAAAVALLVLSLIAAGTTVANKLGIPLGGGNNVILAIIMVVAAARAVEATFKLRGRFAEASARSSAEPSPPVGD